jgi:hypothetical protein
LVVQTVDTIHDQVQRHFTDMSFAEFHGSRGGGRRLAGGQQ